MSKRVGKKALSSLKEITEQVLRSKRVEVAAHKAVTEGAGRSAIRKALKSGAKRGAEAVVRTTKELAGQGTVK